MEHAYYPDSFKTGDGSVKLLLAPKTTEGRYLSVVFILFTLGCNDIYRLETS